MGFWLNEIPGEYTDCTMGGGGHSHYALQKLSPGSVLHGFDRDAQAIDYARQRLKPAAGVDLHIHHLPFSELSQVLKPQSQNGILYDLGVSSRQLDDKSRGFSFSTETPLDLRMDQNASLDAQEWLFNSSSEELSNALYRNSDMRSSRRLARNILAEIDPNTEVLPEHIRRALLKTYPRQSRDINSLLARVFQAVRMEVNGEIYEIEVSLRYAVQALKPGGVLCAISYHSVEDRAVKKTAAEFLQACVCPPRLPICQCGGSHRLLKKLVNKPLLPTSEEVARNPRARSAKLRVYQRL
ncbi:MAG: 16S rRNA (cytosine(1402)-N(4))-methyltransferase RsmH [Fibrobacter sp.]|nr:16S rRNA (cytosine(1402)-N(4))-methyltransferase RsmH [Fibrobacter sp.]